MPIHGLTTGITNDTITRGLARIGTLCKGDSKPENSNKPGAELDYFRVEFNQSTPEQVNTAQTLLIPAWQKLYGDKAETVPGVFLMSDNIDQVFSTWNEEYGKSGLKRRCDGLMQNAWRDESDKMRNDPTKCISGNKPACQCKEHGSLKFVLPALMSETGVLGYFVLNTHSFHDIVFIHGALSHLLNWTGTLRNIPLILTRFPREFQIETANGQRKTKKYLVQLKVDPEFVKSTLVQLVASNQPTLQISETSTAQASESAANEDESEDSANDTQNNESPPQIAWYEDAGTMAKLHKWIADNGYSLDMPFRSMRDYADPRTYCLDFEAAVKERRQAAINDAFAIVDGKVDDTIEADVVEEPLTALPSPTNKPAGEGASYFTLPRLCDELHMSETQVFEMLNVSSQAELGTESEAKGKIIGAAMAAGLPVIVENVTYAEQPKKRMEFKTMYGTITYWKGRQELQSLFDPEIAGVDRIANWKAGDHKLPAPLLLFWLSDPKTNKLTATTFEVK